MAMGSLPRKKLNAFYRSGRWSRVDRERYVPKRGVCCKPATISHITTFGTWNHMDYMFLPSGLSIVTRPIHTMHATGRSRDRPQTCDVVSQVVLVVDRVWDLCLHQDHEVEIHHLGRTDFLRELEAAAVPDIVHSGFQLRRAVRKSFWWWWW